MVDIKDIDKIEMELELFEMGYIQLKDGTRLYFRFIEEDEYYKAIEVEKARIYKIGKE